MNDSTLAILAQQNRRLKVGLIFCGALAAIALLTAAKSVNDRTRFTEIDVERINIVNAGGKVAMVLANRTRLPKAVIDSKEIVEDRNKPGLIV